MQTSINRVGTPGGISFRQWVADHWTFHRIGMSSFVPFRSCPIYIDRAVIVINKPPGVVCQLNDDRVPHRSTALVMTWTDRNPTSSAMGRVSTG